MHWCCPKTDSGKVYACSMEWAASRICSAGISVSNAAVRNKPLWSSVELTSPNCNNRDMITYFCCNVHFMIVGCYIPQVKGPYTTCFFLANFMPFQTSFFSVHMSNLNFTPISSSLKEGLCQQTYKRSFFHLMLVSKCYIFSILSNDMLNISKKVYPVTSRSLKKVLAHLLQKYLCSRMYTLWSVNCQSS